MIAPLTALRFFAAFMVLLHHYFNFYLGYSGVTFFFVLSGFVLAINYADAVGSGDERSVFYLKRLARIYPAHLLTLLLTSPFALQALLHDPTLRGALVGLISFVSNLSLMQAWIPRGDVYFSFNWVSWSISDEAFFYALFPVFTLFLKNLSQSAQRRFIAFWLVAIIALAFACSLRAKAGMEDPLSHWLFYILPATRLVEFVLGIAIGLAFRNGNAGRVGGAIELGVILLIGASLTIPYFLTIPAAFLFSLWFLPASAVTIIAFSRSDGPVSRLLSQRWLVLFGEASFMLYMIHQLLLRYVMAVIGGSLIIRLVTAAFAIGLSIILHLTFERYAQRAMLNWRKGASRSIVTTVTG